MTSEDFLRSHQKANPLGANPIGTVARLTELILSVDGLDMSWAPSSEEARTGLLQVFSHYPSPTVVERAAAQDAHTLFVGVKAGGAQVGLYAAARDAWPE